VIQFAPPVVSPVRKLETTDLLKSSVWQLCCQGLREGIHHCACGVPPHAWHRRRAGERCEMPTNKT